MSVGVVNLSGSLVAMALMDKLVTFSCNVNGHASSCWKFLGIRVFCGVSLCGWRIICLGICHGCRARTWASLVRNFLKPNKSEGNDSMYGCTLGYKFLCWLAIFEDAGATWATDSVHSFCELLFGGIFLCQEECGGNKRGN